MRPNYAQPHYRNVAYRIEPVGGFFRWHAYWPKAWHDHRANDSVVSFKAAKRAAKAAIRRAMKGTTSLETPH
jgi:predicted membrane-bound mannosyltransferase